MGESSVMFIGVEKNRKKFGLSSMGLEVVSAHLNLSEHKSCRTVEEAADLVCSGCHDKTPWTCWASTIEIYFLRVLETGV